MKKYQFKANNSRLQEFIIEIKAYNFIDAREKAYSYCYKMGYCFLGRL